MEVLVLNGKTYVKASKAARDLGYTSDYVGQLCRGGHVDAHLVGRTWFVDAEQLGSHRVEKKRMSRVKAREQAHRSIEEHKKLRTQNTQNSYRNVAIHYEEDKSALIPTVRKLDIASDRSEIKAANDAESKKDDEVPKYTVENQGEKMVMSGKLKIIDASEDQLEKDVILLSPKIERKKRSVMPHTLDKHDVTDSSNKSVKSDDGEVSSNENTFNRKDFLDRLSEEYDISADEVMEGRQPVVLQDALKKESEQIQYTPSSVRARTKEGSNLGLYFIVTLAMLLITFGSVTLESVWSVNINESNGFSFETNYVVNADSAYQSIFKK